MAEPSEIAVDDGLPCAEVGAWAELKYRLFVLYASLFSKGMKYKWDERVYIDLYAGAGFSRVRGTTKIIAGSPILALTVDDPFDKYIFCEQDPQLLSALRERTARIAPASNVAYIPGDCNSRIDDILAQIPPASREHTVLGLCFVDPFGIGIKFDTLRRLSTRYLDFLCLLAVYMDANRNYARYLSEDSRKVDEFLGSADWRQKWTSVQAQGAYFPKFLAEEFAASMKSLEYIPPPLYTMKEVRSDEKNLRLYYLALFSRDERAYEFWTQVLKYGTDQRSLEF
ncbi:MAG: three-Cys-motif partner protein TcmP [Acidobacteriia bacterium]|nr:three-Cys-motif partner protein TcmP [Terriglobia bacterium]